MDTHDVVAAMTAAAASTDAALRLPREKPPLAAKRLAK